MNLWNLSKYKYANYDMISANYLDSLFNLFINLEIKVMLYHVKEIKRDGFVYISQKFCNNSLLNAVINNKYHYFQTYNIDSSINIDIAENTLLTTWIYVPYLQIV